MRFIVPLSLLAFLMACKPVAEQSTPRADDSFQTEQSPETPVPANSTALNGGGDTLIYIGPLTTLEETREYAAALYFLVDAVDMETYNYLEAQLDSVVLDRGDELVRKRLPMPIARRYFKLSGMDTIRMYSTYGAYMGDATMVRVERFESLIESDYRVVFKSTGKFKPDDVRYCVTVAAGPPKAALFDWRVVNDSITTQKLIKQFISDERDIYSVHHVQFFPDSTIYSTIACHRGPSLFIETKNNVAVIMQSVEENTSLLSFFPVHYTVNGRPVFIADHVLNESDGFWTTLLIFDGKQYRHASRGRCVPDPVE